MKKKVVEKKVVNESKKTAEIPYAANSGRVMNDTGIVGDGALVKSSEE